MVYVQSQLSLVDRGLGDVDVLLSDGGALVHHLEELLLDDFGLSEGVGTC